MYWEILGIEPTKDEEVIKEAYHARLHFANPEDDQEGFKELRRAYEDALAFARRDEDAEDNGGLIGLMYFMRMSEHEKMWTSGMNCCMIRCVMIWIPS